MPVDLLRESALFSTCGAQREEIARVCQTQTYKPGETIFKQDQLGNRLFLTAEGQVRISRDIPMVSLLAMSMF